MEENLIPKFDFMKGKRINLKYYSVISLVVGLFMISVMSSCTKKFTFSNSAVVPAAQGSVKVKSDKNSNYALRLTVRHLSPPDRLVGPKNSYVVWVNTRSNGVKNIGQLKSSGGLFSKGLKSSLETVTTFEPVSFFITAENVTDISYPVGQVVLTTE